ncbi:MAG: hypothetical protein N3F65_01890 [Nitrososphaeria archaeon]|nr:hypothetical protein [Nitrososphaeria archaeon]
MVTHLIDVLKELSKRGSGPQPMFREFEFLDLLLVLEREGVIGRKRLSEYMGVGEGVTRTMIRRLKSQSLIEISGKWGCKLSEKGKRMVEEIKKLIKNVGSTSLKLPWDYPSNYVLLIKGGSGKVKRGLEQRDEAIKAGAKALMILSYVDSKLMMPGISDLTVEKPEFAESLIKTLKPEEGDVILIAAGDSLLEARKGALAAAQTLL